jgi:hypothetical protein
MKSNYEVEQIACALAYVTYKWHNLKHSPFGVVVHQVKGAICHINVHQDSQWSRNLQMKLHLVDETIELLIEKKD